MRNSSGTLRWTVSEHVRVKSKKDALRIIAHAQASSLRITTISPFRWSWATTIAQNNNINVQVTLDTVTAVGNTVVADAGALVSAVFRIAQTMNNN